MADGQDPELGTNEARELLALDAKEFKTLVRLSRVKETAPGRWRIADVVRARIKALIVQASFYTTPAMAKALGISDERVRQLMNEGVLKQSAYNKFHRDDTTRAYASMLRDQRHLVNRTTSESRVRDARATEIEMRTAERSRKLIPLDEALESNASVCGAVRTEFGGLAARVTRDLVLRREIEKAVNDCFARIANRLAEEGRRLATGGDADDAVTDDAAGSMGEDESALPADGGATGSA